MFNWLKERAITPELMDDFSMGGRELTEALQHLRRLNRIFGAAGPTLYGVQRLWNRIGRPKQLSILDIGAGSGDVNQHLFRWADMENIELTLTLADITEEAVAQARILYQKVPRVRVIQQDLFQLSENQADIVTSSQFVHHFASEDIPHVLRCMLQASRCGIVINDIHRHWMAWTAVWTVTHLISGNRYIRNDGPLSVAKGFRARDWERLKQARDLETLTYSWRPLFRYAVIVPKGEGRIRP